MILLYGFTIFVSILYFNGKEFPYALLSDKREANEILLWSVRDIVDVKNFFSVGSRTNIEK